MMFTFTWMNSYFMSKNLCIYTKPITSEREKTNFSKSNQVLDIQLIGTSTNFWLSTGEQVLFIFIDLHFLSLGKCSVLGRRSPGL